MKRVVIRPAARDDLVDAQAWYENQRSGLGAEFLGCIDAAMQAIGREPGLATAIGEGFHRVLIRRFPFGIYFIEDPEALVVLAVLHHRRHPQLWRTRT